MTRVYRRAMPWPLLLLLMLFAYWADRTSSQEQDSRCYLTTGGSSESFTVSESAKIGSVLWSLPIVGNVSSDIDLTLLQEDSNPVFIRGKTLVLSKELDRDGPQGIQDFQINVLCSKRNSRDPNITIPVRIHVSDANDNAPIFVDQPYFLNASEVAVVGSTFATGIRALDADQPGGFSTVEYYVQRGPYSHLLEFENRLEPSVLVLSAPFDFESLPNFTLTVRAQDRGNPPLSALATLHVTVVDADDQNPRFLHERYVAHLPDHPRPGILLRVTPEAIKAEDPDEGIRADIVYSFNDESNEYSYFRVNEKTGQVYVRRPLPETLSLPVTLVLRATQVDNADRYALTTLTVTSQKPLPSELRFLQTDYVTAVLESTPLGQVLLTLQTTKTIDDQSVQLRIINGSETNEEFAILDTGALILVRGLDYERRQQYVLQVMASDGKQSDIARVNITVMNVNDNDPIFQHKQYSFNVDSANVRIGSLVGTVRVNDADLNDTVELSISGPFAKAFSISQSGEIRIRDLELLNNSVCHLIAVATDNGLPPRQSSASVTVTFPEEVALGGLGAIRTRREEGSYVLLIVFGVLLGSLLVVILTLTVYILKSKQYRDRLPAILTSSSRVAGHKIASTTPFANNKKEENGGRRTPGVENPIFNVNLAKNGRPESHRGDGHISAWEGANDSATTRVEDEDDQEGMLKGSRIHNIHWPNGSIPRRVKKLSWEDEQANRTELDPDVSVAPLGRIPRPAEATVYF